MIPNRPADLVHRDLFDGEGKVEVWDLQGQSPWPPFRATLACRLGPEGNVGMHVQEHFPELVIGVAGQGKAYVDGEAYELCPGAVIYLPLGATLALQNDRADGPLDYLIVKAGG